MKVDWTSIFSDTLSGLIVAVITAAVSLLLVKRYLSKLNFSNKMRSHGFQSSGTNRQTKREIRYMCENAELIKIINVSGFHYLNENEKYLKAALKKGVHVQFLCAHPESAFLTDIEKMERRTIDDNGAPLRGEDSKISNEIYDLKKKYQDTKIEIRLYSSEYRLPFVIAYFKDKSIRAWLTMTLPPYKSTESFVLRGIRDSQEIQQDGLNFIDMMECNFDTIWEQSTPIKDL